MAPHHLRFCHGLGTALVLALAAIGGPASAQSTVPISTLPTGGHVVAGSATIGAPAGNTLTINQNSSRAVANWNTFSVGVPNTVNFLQPNSAAAILNRVTGSTPSSIAGQINANGQVYLVNPNGIAITPSGSVQVGGGFVASTLGITDRDFMSGNLSFTGNGASAGVSNAGTITAGPGGSVALIGGTAANSGTISVPLGKVALGSGERATLDLNGDGFMQVAAPTGATTAKGQALVGNSGRIDAAGGSVELRAATVASAIHNAVNMSGVIAVNSISGHDGAITLSGGPGGAVNVTGTLDASAAPATSANGGAITVDGARVRVGHHAIVNASGAKGGKVLVGVSGPNGQGEAAETTIASGAQILANGDATVTLSGGYIETSGGRLKLGGATIEAGRGGTWLTDPDNLIIDATAATTIDTALAAGTNVTEMTTNTGFSGVGNVVTGGAGDITVASALSWNSVATLTLSAFNSIIIDAPITAPTTAGIGGGLVLTYNNNQGGTNTNGSLSFVMGQGNATFTEAANSQLFINNGTPGGGGATPYTLIYNTSTGTDGLKGANGVTGGVALANDLDATGLTTADGSAIVPTLNASFNGLGHTISNLTISSGTFGANVGLFGEINGGALVANLGVVGGSITGASSATVGGLAGSNSGTIYNSYATGAINGGDDAGGLAAINFGSISQSYATGAISGDERAGGLVSQSVTGAVISNSYATGSVSGIVSGGLVAINDGHISNAFATGTVAGGSETGGLAGENTGSNNITTSYWDTSSSGIPTKGVGLGDASGVTGKTTAQLAAALPTGFASLTWGNVYNQTTPYILTNPGPVQIGTEEGSSAPYFTLVFTPAQLQAIGNAGNLAGHFVLAQDIDATGVTGFVPIGNESTPFSGTFDGLGNVIANLVITTDNHAQVGVFGASSGIIENVGVIGGSVTAPLVPVPDTGGLVGFNTGTITNSYATVPVTGIADTGGLVGANVGSGTISDSYETGTVVSGDGSNVGGLVGANVDTTITDSYATGSVTGGAGSAVGGLVGVNVFFIGGLTNIYAAGAVSGGTGAMVGGLVGMNNTSVTNGYWNSDRAGTGNTGVGSGSSAGVIQVGAAVDSSPFAAAAYPGFNFTQTPGLTGNNWVMVEPNGTLATNGSAAIAATMPILASEAQSTIQNAHQLQLLAMNTTAGKLGTLTGSYTLGRSVDASGTGTSVSISTGTDVWGSTGFVPIGGNGVGEFGGTLNGLNTTTGLSNTISNLTINTSQFYAGLFGQTAGTIENLGLVGGSVTSSNAGSNNGIGSLAGFQGGGTIFQTYATMPVTGNGAGELNVGGLVGFQQTGTISQSFATGAVSLTSPFISHAGGLVGQSGGTITLSFASGAVTGTSDAFVGGLAGFSGGAINNSYATGAVRATSNGVAGGLVGGGDADIGDTYATGAVTGGSGLIGNYFGGTLLDNYWDVLTTGTSNGVGGGNQSGVTAMTTAQLQSLNLSTAFAGPSNWGIVTGKSYPYLCWQFAGCVETPQVVSGTVYADQGTTPASPGPNVFGLVNGTQFASLLTGGTVGLGANGYYYYLLAPNTIPSGGNVVTYEFGSLGPSGNGAALADRVSGSVTGLNIFAGTLHEVTSQTTYSTVKSDLVTALGGNSLPSGLVNLQVDASGAFGVDTAIPFGSGTVTLNAQGPVTQTNIGLITAQTLAGSSVGGVTLTAVNSFSNVGPWTDTGTNSPGIDILSSIALTTTGAIQSTGPVTLISSNLGDPNLTVSTAVSGTTVTLFANGSITEAAGGSIAATNLIATTQIDAGGAITLNQPGVNAVSGNVTLTSVTATTPARASGAIDFADTLGFTVAAATSSGPSLSAQPFQTGVATLTSANLVSGGSIQEAGGAVITAQTLTGSSVGGATLTGSNAVPSVGPWSDTGAGSAGFVLNDAQNLTVTGAIGTVSGPITLTTNGALGLNADLTTPTGTVTLTGLSGMTQETGAITAATLTGSSLNGDTDLDDVNRVSVLGSFTTDSGSDFSLVNGTNLTVSGTISAGAIKITTQSSGEADLTLAGTLGGASARLIANGAITQTGGAITTPNLQAVTQFATGGTVSLMSASNATTNVTLASLDTAGTALTGGAITLVNSTAVNIHDFGGTFEHGIDTTGSASVRAGGTLGGDGTIVAGTFTGGSVGGATLTGANQVTVLGPFSDSSGTVTFTNTQPLSVVGPVNAAAITLTTTGAGSNLTLNGNLTADGGTVALNSSGGITQSGGVIDPTSLLIQSAGPVTMPGNNVVGTLAAQLTDAGAGLSFNDTATDLAIGMVGGVTGITTNNGNVNLTVATSGGLTIGNAITAGTGAVTAASVGDLALGAAGTVSGGPITLATNGNFTNAAGAAALSAGDGNRWLVYSTNPANDSGGGLSPAFIQYAATYPIGTPGTPTAPLGSGNGLLYSVAPMVTINTVTKTYDGTVALPTDASAYSISGGINGDTVSLNLSGLTGAYAAANAGTAIGVSLDGVSINQSHGAEQVFGYGLTIANGGNAGVINPAALTITASNQTKTYGQTAALGTTAFTTTPLFNNDSVTGVTLASTGAPASATVTGSPFAITASNAVGTGLSNYTITYVSGSLMVAPAALTITASNQTKPYGQTAALGTTAFTTTPLFNNDSVTGVTLASGGSTVAGSPYAITASNAVGTGLSNYTISYVDGSLIVTPAALTITASNQTKTYGQTAALGTTAFTSSPLFNNDSVTGVTLASTGAAATATVAGSPYAITASNAVGGGLSNYTISYVDGSLTVTPAALTITASNQTKTYGQTAALGTTAFTTSTLFNNDSVTGVTLASTGAAATATAAGSPYAITASNAVGNGVSNYTISYVDGSLTVTPAALTITASNQTKTYGQTAALGTTAFTTSTLFNNDSVTGATLASGGSTVAGSPYAITASNAVGSGLSNYTISYVSGLLAVTPATLTAGLTGTVGKTYDGTTAATLTPANYTLTGVVGNDDVSLNDPTSGIYASANVSPGIGVSVGGLALGGGAAGNYTLAGVSANANIGTITARPLTVAADDLSRSFGQANPPLTFSITAGTLVSGDGLTGAPFTAAAPDSAAGSYAITQGTLAASSNYTVAFVDGTLVVLANPNVPATVVNFGASPDKYIPPTQPAPPSQPGLTQCSPVTLATLLKLQGSATIFGAESSACGDL